MMMWLAYAGILGLFARLAYTDMKFQKLYNRDILYCLPIAAINIWFSSVPFVTLFVGIVLSGIFFIYHYIAYAKGYCGGGDVKLMTMVPLIFNPMSTWFSPLIWILIVIFSFIVSQVLLLIKKGMPESEKPWRKKKIPLGLPMGISVWIVIMLQISLGGSL